MKLQKFSLSLALALLASPAFAHLPPGEYGSFAAGFSHPLFGLDHILAMVAVGLWASMLGKRALWAVPTAFVAVMIVGFALALLGAPLPFVEPMILASTMVLGLVVAMAIKPGIGYAVALVGLFALFHGHAHGGELGEAGALRFGIGFVLATAMLHAIGIGLGMLVRRLSTRLTSASDLVSRGLGALTMLAGASLAFG